MNVRRFFIWNDLNYVYEVRVDSKAERVVRRIATQMPEPLQHIIGTLMFLVLIPLELLLVLPLLSVWMIIDRFE